MKYDLCSTPSKVFLVAALLLIPTVAQGQSAGSSENREGLEDHRAVRFEAALAHFEQALEQDAGLHIAGFNAACALAKLNRTDEAMARVESYLSAQPGEVLRVLHDADLETLWSDGARMQTLRARIRPAGSEVREILFERRDTGQLFAAADDGLDVLQLTHLEDRRAHQARFAADGRFVVYRARRLDGELGGEANYIHPMHRYRDRYNEELHVMPYPEGDPVVVGTYVRHYDLQPDGATILMVTAPRAPRPSAYVQGQDGAFEIRRAVVGTEGSELVGTVSSGPSSFCLQTLPDGEVLVAMATWFGWGSESLKVVRLAAGAEETVVFEQRHRVRASQRFSGVGSCQLSPDGTSLDLGSGIVHLNEPTRLQAFPESPATIGHVFSRRSESRAADMLPPARWRVDPMSYGTDYGMADHEHWNQTALFRVMDSPRRQERVSPENAFIEYGASMPGDDGRFLFTRLQGRMARPWVYVGNLDGSEAQKVVPGQFPVWSPFLHTVQQAGLAIAHGSVADPDPGESGEATIEMEVATEGAAGPSAPPTARGCACSTSHSPKGAAGWCLLVACVLHGRRRRSRR